MTTSTMPHPATIQTSVDKFVEFLESGGVAPVGLFTPTVFGDLISRNGASRLATRKSSSLAEDGCTRSPGASVSNGSRPPRPGT
jgi:hypothetical protein